MNYLCYAVSESSDTERKYARHPGFSSADADSLLEAIEKVEHHMYNMGRLYAVDASYDEFFSFYRSLDGKDDTLFPELERKLRAYIIEFRIYLDHWQKYVAHHSRGKEYKELFAKLTHHAYDSCDEYAIVYMLRNYVVHANDLIHCRLNSEDGNVFQIGCSKEMLLQDDTLKAKEKAIIRRQPAQMIVLDMILKRSRECLHEIHKSMMEFQTDNEVRESCKVIRNAYSFVFMTGFSNREWDIVDDRKDYVWAKSPESDIWYANGTSFHYHRVNWKKYTETARYLLDLS